MFWKRFIQGFFYATVAVIATSIAAAPQPIAPTPAASQSVSANHASDAQVWNLKDADIRAVIQTVSVLTGKNFIIDPRVQGKVTLISQKPMTPDELYQVFLSMLQMLQYSAIPTGNIIKIVPAMDANSLSRQIATEQHPGKGDEIVVRVVPVNHVSAAELVPVLRPLMSQSGSVSAYIPSNTLILAGTAANIERLVKMIHRMDSNNATQISVVPLHYANAKKVVSVIHALETGNPMQGGMSNATLAADSSDNSILVSANMANQLMMKNLIHQLDQPGSSGDNTKVVTLNYLSAKKLAPILQKVAQGMSVSDAVSAGKAAVTSGNNSDISIEAEDSTNAIIIHAPKAMMNGLMHVIHRLDARPQEVLVEAIIVKVSESLLNKLGIVWGTSNGGATVTNAAGTSSTAVPTIAENGAFAIQSNYTSGRISVGFLPSNNLIGLLRALNTNGSTDVLSTPSIVVLDNEKASILNGQNIGEANRSYQGSSATTTGNPAQNIVTPYNTLQRTNVGLSLDVTPHITPNKMIRMILLQKDDTVDPSTPAGSINPIIDTSKIKTSVLVKSGHILVLGGLIDNQEEKTMEKLPILGYIPLLGHLFSYDKHQLEKTSLMVFIRPIVMTRHSAHEQTFKRYQYLRDQEKDLRTEAIKKQAKMSLLPSMNQVKLPMPQPSPAFHLPTPLTTKSESLQ